MRDLQAPANGRPLKFHFCVFTEYLIGDALERFMHGTGTAMKTPTELHHHGISGKCVVCSVLSRKDGQAWPKEQYMRQDGCGGQAGMAS